MPFNMAWFQKQEELKKQAELAKKKAENPEYTEPTENITVSNASEKSRIL